MEKNWNFLKKLPKISELSNLNEIVSAYLLINGFYTE